MAKNSRQKVPSQFSTSKEKHLLSNLQITLKFQHFSTAILQVAAMFYCFIVLLLICYEYYGITLQTFSSKMLLLRARKKKKKIELQKTRQITAFMSNHL